MGSMTSCTTREKLGWCSQCSMLRFWPVKKLSITTTSWPKLMSLSTRCDPTNPAPPVTRIFNRSASDTTGVRITFGVVAVGTDCVAKSAVSSLMRCAAVESAVLRCTSMRFPCPGGSYTLPLCMEESSRRESCASGTKNAGNTVDPTTRPTNNMTHNCGFRRDRNILAGSSVSGLFAVRPLLFVLCGIAAATTGLRVNPVIVPTVIL
mmetsp:Transcript_17664/g.31905  ORF Transcript_17664/g.31905 Transcript_17664/m.31905 type:complete len:207 (-) Transcript_17664:61-681(-)